MYYYRCIGSNFKINKRMLFTYVSERIPSGDLVHVSGNALSRTQAAEVVYEYYDEYN